jgi:hypothetical protein
MTDLASSRIRCRECRNLMTWAASRVQYGRALRRDLTAEQAKATQPLCQKCMTKYLRAISEQKTVGAPCGTGDQLLDR